MPTSPSLRSSTHRKSARSRRGILLSVFGVCAFAAFLGLAGLAFRGPSPAGEPLAPQSVYQRASKETPAPLETDAVVAHEPSPSAARGRNTDETDPLPLGAPSVAKVREEARANPHDTPPSSLAFATRVSRMEQSAEGDSAALAELANSLSACALANSSRMPQTVRLFCAERLERLALRHPAEAGSVSSFTLSRMPASHVAQAARKGFQ